MFDLDNYIGKDRQNYPISGFTIDKTAKIMKQHFSAVLNELNAGITVDQWVVLQVLFREGPMKQFQIAEKVFKDRPTITRILDLLSKKRLINRVVDSEDRRSFKINISNQGIQRVKNLSPHFNRFLEKSYHGISIEQLQELNTILSRIQSNLS